MRHLSFIFKSMVILTVAIALTFICEAQTATQPPSLRVLKVTIAPDGASQAVVSPADGDGKAIRGLAAANFQVTEDGLEAAPLSLAPAQSGEVPISVVLAMDISGSMRGAKREAAVKGASAFVDQLGKSDLCALVTFGTGVREIVDFTSVHELVKRELAGLRASDRETYLYQGIFDSLDRAGKAPTNRSAVVLLTDGQDEGSSLGTQEVLAKIAAREVPIYALGYGKDTDTKTLKRFAAASHGQFYLATEGADISGAFTDVAKELQNDYLLTWTTSGRPIHAALVTIKMQYLGQTVSSSLTSNVAANESLMPPEQPKPRVRWWLWTAGLGVIVVLVVMGLLAIHKNSRQVPPELAQTMVPPRVWLEVIKGADMGQKSVLFGKDAIIGRDPRAAQIVLKSDPMAGRKHARLYENAQGLFVIEDLNSQNGVSVNGIKISEPVTLQSDDHIVVGLTELVFIDQR